MNRCKDTPLNPRLKSGVKKERIMRRFHTYHDLNYHLVFVTKNRERWMSREVLAKLRELFLVKANEHDFIIHIVNGYEDHVHLLVSLPPKLSVSEVVQFLKGYSSKELGDRYY